jgi:Tfp pilus assembly protein FimV
MPDRLNDDAVMKERRKNLVDVLKAAIERDPSRHDLRMKLLEAYYGAAATNQRAFVELARKLSGNREHLSADDWEKVRIMGRQIAGNDARFFETTDKVDLPDCA